MIRHRPLDTTTWPGQPIRLDRLRKPSRFSASWRTVKADLEREVNHLARRRHSDVYLEVDLPPSALRLDGGIRADRLASVPPPVAITIQTPAGEMRLATDLYRSSTGGYLPGWQANVRAISLTLAALRDSERHGVLTGEQYRGLQAIGATSTGVALGAGLTAGDALALLARVAGEDEDTIALAATVPANWTAPDAVARLYRRAARVCHPDTGDMPSPDVFARITEARDLLLRR